MAKKNVFANLLESGSFSDLPAREAFPSSRPLQAIRTSITDLHKMSFSEIPVSQITSSAFNDRIRIDEGLDELVESLRDNGQEVPIRVRPKEGGGYEVVTGRRRLAAARTLGWETIKGFITDSTDAEAVTSLAAENAGRLNSSYIGKAVFCHNLIAAGFERSFVAKIMTLTDSYIRKMLGVVDAFGIDAIQAIGDAHEIGSPRWISVAKEISKLELTQDEVFQLIPKDSTSVDDLFSKLSAALDGMTDVEVIGKDQTQSDQGPEDHSAKAPALPADSVKTIGAASPKDDPRSAPVPPETQLVDPPGQQVIRPVRKRIMIEDTSVKIEMRSTTMTLKCDETDTYILESILKQIPDMIEKIRSSSQA